MTTYPQDGIQTRQAVTREDAIREEWAFCWNDFDINGHYTSGGKQKRWPGIPTVARRMVGKTIAFRALQGTIADFDALVADTIDLAYAAYRRRYAEAAPRVVYRAIAQNLKFSSRNAVRNYLDSRKGLVRDHILDNALIITGQPRSTDEDGWIDVILRLPPSSGRELLLKVAYGKAQGMTHAEITRELGFRDNRSVHTIEENLRKLLRSYYLTWLLEKIETKQIRFSPGQFFDLLFTL